MTNLRWGVLSTANIGLKKVIPAMHQAQGCLVEAIASSDEVKAREAAAAHNIPRHYGNYQALLEDPNIDAVYNPLPNHLHVDWTIKCLQAGKHVLCEKPFANNTDDIKKLIAAQNITGRTVGEAFMIKAHPQWRKVLELIDNAELGQVMSVHGAFYYSNADPKNIRNKANTLGGAMMDIGCYPLMVARMVFGAEPKQVFASMKVDAQFKTDTITAAILEFENGYGTFTVGTQTVPHQKITVLGSKKRLEILVPFNAPNHQATEIHLFGGDILAPCEKTYSFDPCDQYTLQAEQFCHAVQQGTEPATNLHESFKNAAAIEALFASAKIGQSVKPALLGDA